MTATRDGRRDAEVGSRTPPWWQRSAFGRTRGWTWWGAVLLAVGLSMAGAYIDMRVHGELGILFKGAYFLGCVGAVCIVRRRNVFGPMVQAPLILTATIPTIILLTKGLPKGASIAQTLGIPLVVAFPTMAITTGATVAIGGIRFLIQRPPPGGDPDDDGGPGNARRKAPVRGAAQGNRLDRGERNDRRGLDDRGSVRRPPAGGGQPGAARAPAREDRGGTPRDRTRMQPPPARGRGGPDRAQGQGQRGGLDRGGLDGGGFDRTQQRRGGGRPGGRDSRDDGRRQPPQR